MKVFNQKVFILKHSGDIVSINVILYISLVHREEYERVLNKNVIDLVTKKKVLALLDETISDFFHYLKT